MGQSKNSPRFATDATYTGGTYNGQANKVIPSAGLTATGFVPGTKLPYPRLNHLINNHGEHLENVIDQAALTWMPRQVSGLQSVITSGVSGGGIVGPFGAGANRLLRNRERMIVPVMFTSSISRRGLIALGSNVNGVVHYTYDGYAWQLGSGASLGAAAVTDVYGPVVGYVAGEAAIIIWDGLGTGGTKNISWSDNEGNTWTAATDIANGARAGIYFNGAWLLAHNSGHISRSTNLAGAWTDYDLSAGGDFANPRRAACGPGSVVFAGAADTIAYSVAGTSWAKIDVTGNSGNSVRCLCWSDAWGCYVIHMDNDTTWTMVPGSNPVLLVTDPDINLAEMCAFGRCIVGVEDDQKGEILVSRDLGETYISTGINTTLRTDSGDNDGFSHVFVWGNRMVAATVRAFDPGGTNETHVEYCMSACAPHTMADMNGVNSLA